jgi:molybdopterin converting factor small subunit
MKIQVLFFGPLAEATSIARMELMNIQDTDALKTQLENRFPAIGKITYKFALNQEIATTNQKLKDGDEVALLAPFAGG